MRACRIQPQHDCWLNDAPGTASADRHPQRRRLGARGRVQTTGFLPSGATGFFGAHTITPIYAPFMIQGPERAHRLAVLGPDRECEDWYATPSEITSTRISVTPAPPAPTARGRLRECAVQSLEVASGGARGMEPDGTMTAGPVTRMHVFFTTDGYSGATASSATPSAPAAPDHHDAGERPRRDRDATEGTDCFVAWPARPDPAQCHFDVTAARARASTASPPVEAEFEVWNLGAGTATPGWWIYIKGDLIGWFPPRRSTGPTARRGAVERARRPICRPAARS